MTVVPGDHGGLLDRPVVGAADVAAVEDAVAGLLDTTGDVLLIQGEAIVALEATARGLAQRGSRAEHRNRAVRGSVRPMAGLGWIRRHLGGRAL
ncbi:hypothetical protein ABIB25_000361 [Nakamurella sp. UYEF19]|uniref:hypothetical protein n=1 Tax=Nakamurella sp. UYEF19 TaxID=1756392 RepID=UPI003396E832